MTFDVSDILVVPFPFIDSPRSKYRPIVVLTKSDFNHANGHCLAAMITTASHSEWVGDTKIKDLASAGLKYHSIIRMKIFTLDVRVGVRKIGQLSGDDKAKFFDNLRLYTGI